MSNAIKTEQLGEVLIITFTRPEIRNPLSIAVLEQLTVMVETLPDDVAKLVFTGSGGVFASGADLREIAQVDGKTASAFALRGQRLMKAVDESRAVTIAAVNGYCYGGALDLALACDVRIAAPNAEFCHPGAGLGIMTGWGGTQRLPRLIGESAALEIFILGKRVDAENAKAIGLIDLVADDPLGESIAYRPLPRP